MPYDVRPWELLHHHVNLLPLDKIGESGGNPTWDGQPWPGGGGPSADEKVKASATDPAAGYLSEKVAASVTVAGEKLRLEGDAATPGANRYYGTDGVGAKGFHALPGGGGLTVLQQTLLGVTTGDDGVNPPSSGNPKTVEIAVPYQTDFKKLRVNPLKLDPGASGVVRTECAFDAADASRFQPDDKLLFDGTMRMKTRYVPTVTNHGALGSGVRFSAPIERTGFALVEKVEVA